MAGKKDAAKDVDKTSPAEAATIRPTRVLWLLLICLLAGLATTEYTSSYSPWYQWHTLSAHLPEIFWVNIIRYHFLWPILDHKALLESAAKLIVFSLVFIYWHDSRWRQLLVLFCFGLYAIIYLPGFELWQVHNNIMVYATCLLVQTLVFFFATNLFGLIFENRPRQGRNFPILDALGLTMIAGIILTLPSILDWLQPFSAKSEFNWESGVPFILALLWFSGGILLLVIRPRFGWSVCISTGLVLMFVNFAILFNIEEPLRLTSGEVQFQRMLAIGYPPMAMLTIWFLEWFGFRLGVQPITRLESDTTGEEEPEVDPFA
ncbi:MAG: hypothetical protein KF851_07615 [Pirellulaceae bacterium]|nr:hypothetical protein [Pirellulaceae bacterium]